MLPVIDKTLIFSLIEICITLIVTLLLNSLLRSFIHVPAKLDTRRGRTYVAVMRSIVTIILFSISLNVIFFILKINLAPLLASAGIVGLTLGIGARSFIEDLIAGFFLLTQDSIAIGDYVTIGTTEGTIQDIGFRSIKITGINGALNIIPNGQVKHVINFSRGRAIIHIDLPIKTGQKLETVSTILNDILQDVQNDEKIDYHISEESHVLGITNILTGNAMIVRVVLMTTPGFRESASIAYRARAIKELEKHKILFA